jgi:hypothetical protein
MPDPVTGAVVLAKAMGSEQPEDVTAAGNLLTRLLGPSVDAFGAALARSVEYRTRNFGRIAARAQAKSLGDCNRIVNTRVAFVMLEDGSLCDDELMAEYLGGVLAGARTPSGQDDRAVSWIKLISGLSAITIRAHYLLYREWAASLHGLADFKLGLEDNAKAAQVYVDLDEFEQRLVTDSDMNLDEASDHAVQSLLAASLLGSRVASGSRELVAPGGSYERMLNVMPSPRGCELYGWAQGLSGLNGDNFTTGAAVFDAEPPIPRLERIKLLPYR